MVNVYGKCIRSDIVRVGISISFLIEIKFNLAIEFYQITWTQILNSDKNRQNPKWNTSALSFKCSFYLWFNSRLLEMHYPFRWNEHRSHLDLSSTRIINLKLYPWDCKQPLIINTPVCMRKLMLNFKINICW